MPLDAGTVRRACRGVDIMTARQLCRAELERFRAVAAQGDPVLVGCTQEAPLFAATAEQATASDVRFVNVRETAGWSDQAYDAGPKMAALIAAARERESEVAFVHLTSQGAVLICGRDEKAIETALLLKDHLNVTVLLSQPADIAPRRVNEFPIAKGVIRSASGHLGAFKVIVDDFALAAPSSRARLDFESALDGAKLQCDIILDVSGNTPFFPAPALRDGYVRADPGNPTEVLRAALKARDLVGDFDKPRYVTFTEELCAHSRSGIVGCRRCLDLCPAGAIVPNGDHVTIDTGICAGCGQCTAACPTGAAAYALPPADALLRKVRALLTIYRETGGRNPVLLLHDSQHGSNLIDALARYGPGLPANTLPLGLNEITQIGLESIVAAFAYGASDVRLLVRAKPLHDLAGLHKTVALAQPILGALGYGSLATIETDDPDILGAELRAIDPQPSSPRPASFMPTGQKRELLHLALRALHDAAPTAVESVALPAGAPFGSVEIDTQGCTLCLACVAVCPTGALRDDPERPALRFAEDACVQCGLCEATCPEKVITLVPRIDFAAVTAPLRVLKQEEPFTCIRCGKPFGVKSTIERVSAKLAGQHWMYRGGAAKRLDLIKMCDTCRVATVTQDEFDPHGAPPRPQVRTTDDYLRPHADGKTIKSDE
ncbi:MAG TPA: 4Fe-4S dicluster domain-containing protein [Xanthobacteraceae bacterium]|nr:4Fe-4S dicluster domain-containing protein [Xanthobacteraceae bacterium]